MNEAIKQGWKEIVTHAARKGGYNGYYTWARLGYEPKDSMFKIEDHIKNTIKEFNLTYNTDVDNFTELLSIKEGQEWWKKNGQDFVGYFILDENSNSYITLKNYIEERYGK